MILIKKIDRKKKSQEKERNWKWQKCSASRFIYIISLENSVSLKITGTVIPRKMVHLRLQLDLHTLPLAVYLSLSTGEKICSNFLVWNKAQKTNFCIATWKNRKLRGNAGANWIFFHLFLRKKINWCINELPWPRQGAHVIIKSSHNNVTQKCIILMKNSS